MGPDRPAADLLVAGPEREPRSPGRRPSRRLVLLGVAAAVLLVLGDRAFARHEVDVLLARVQAAERTSEYADRRLSGTVEYASSLASPDVPVVVRDDLRRIIREEAAGQVPSLQRARRRVAAVQVLPWHRAERRARDASLRLLDARVQRLQEIARDLNRLYQRQDEPGASALAARAALERVAPPGRLDGLLGP